MHRVNTRILQRLSGSTARKLRPSCQSYQCQTPPSRLCFSALSFDDASSNLPQQVDLLERYRGLVATGIIQYDEEQLRVVMQLRRLQRELIDYAPPAICSNLIRPTVSDDAVSANNADLWWVHQESENLALADVKSVVRARGYLEELATMTTPKGLLVTGQPGSGKSFLVDLWFSGMPTRYKARKHYNQLVLEIYRGVWEETQRRMSALYMPPLEAPEPWNDTVRRKWQHLLNTGSLKTPQTTVSAVPPASPTIAFTIAKRLLLHHWLLVFDEIQLLDVSSANLLADVLSWFWRMGGVIVGTSNKVPDDLYRNGVQRERLEPFVEALKARCPVLTMQSENDWREFRARSSNGPGTWFTFGQEAEFETTLKGVLMHDHPEPQNVVLNVFGRVLQVPWASDNVCRFTFDELCDTSLGPADYLSLASTYPIIAIDRIPILKLSAKNQARRFISLIDALYEARCQIICSAETTLDALFFPDALGLDRAPAHIDVMMAEAVTETQASHRPNVSSYDSPQMAEAPVAPPVLMPLDSLSIFSGQDEQFAFKRALSRLVEMTSSAYVQTQRWTPLHCDDRKWETNMPHRDMQEPSSPDLPVYVSDDIKLDLDFADEAAQTNVKLAAGPPRIREEHMWGVREDWGKKAKRWGKGAAAYDSQVDQKKSLEDQDLSTAVRHSKRIEKQDIDQVKTATT